MVDIVKFNRSVSTHINSYACNANPFLHDLQPNDELYATASVQFAAADTKQHGKIGVRARRLALMDDAALDVLELCFGPDGIVSFATAQTAEDVSRFFVSSNFC